MYNTSHYIRLKAFYFIPWKPTYSSFIEPESHQLQFDLNYEVLPKFAANLIMVPNEFMLQNPNRNRF